MTTDQQDTSGAQHESAAEPTEAVGSTQEGTMGSSAGIPPVTERQVSGQADPRPRPRTWPIVWGVLVLAFCAYTAFQAVAPGSVDGTAFVITVLIGLGSLLLIVGAAVIAKSARSTRR